MKIKNYIVFLTLILNSTVNFGQYLDDIPYPKNSLTVTPLMNLINDSRAYIIYKRNIQQADLTFINARLGTNGFQSQKNNSNQANINTSSSVNIILGVEFGWYNGKIDAYLGADYGYMYRKIQSGNIIPLSGFPFQESRYIYTEISSRNYKSELNLHNVIVTAGIKYNLYKSLFLGMESAVALSSYIVLAQSSNSISPQLIHNGNLLSFAPNRFIFIEYQF